MNGSSRSQNDGLSLIGACAVLGSVVWLAFGQTVGSQFINCDDGMYVYENPIVTRGLTWRGIPWAFTFARIGHWHPVTWFSHMLDCQLFGLWAGGHHAMNVFLHAAVAILLFLALNQMTGSFFRSAIVAALFAVHPQRAESVAWIATQRCIERRVFYADADRVCQVCARTAFHLPLSAGRAPVCSRTDVQGHVGHGAVCLVTFGLLAVATLAAGS